MKYVSSLGISRRELGRMAGATVIALAGSSCAPAYMAQQGTAPTPLDRLGIQLHTVRESFQEDPAGTLQAVAEAGFSEVEFGSGGYFSREPAALKDALDAAGLTAPSMHIGPAELGGKMDQVIAMAKGVGAQHVVLPYVVQQMRESVASWQEVARLCNKWAGQCAAEGLRFAYHNHAFEFDEVGQGTTGFDVLIAETDPSLVELELDFYWTHVAGQDPLSLIDQHAGRISLCHAKDVDAQGNMCLPGEGIIDYRTIFAHGEKAGLRHIFVEFDRLLKVDVPRMRASAEHLSGLEFS